MPSGSTCCPGSGENVCVSAFAPEAEVSSSMFEPTWPRPRRSGSHCSISSTVMYSRPLLSGSPYVVSQGRSTPTSFALLHVVTKVLPPSTDTESLTSVSP